MLMAIGFVLPFFTGQIPQIGNMLLPMHIPVLLCGFICGPQYGITVGFILPLLRSMLFSAPILYPTAISMAFELATYGFLSGFLFNRAKWKCLRSLYRALLISMLSGRIIWGITQAILVGAAGNSFTISAFIASAFTNAIPGIILQLVLIPILMLALKNTHFMPKSTHITADNAVKGKKNINQKENWHVTE